MKKIDLGQTIQLLANIGVLGGILFLAFELKEMNRTTRLAAAEQHAVRANALDLMVYENPMLMQAQDLSPSDPRVVQWVYFTRMRLRDWQTTFYQYEQGALDENLFEAFEKDVQISLFFDTALVESWATDLKPNYVPAFAKFLDDQIKQSSSVLAPSIPDSAD